LFDAEALGDVLPVAEWEDEVMTSGPAPTSSSSNARIRPRKTVALMKYPPCSRHPLHHAPIETSFVGCHRVDDAAMAKLRQTLRPYSKRYGTESDGECSLLIKAP
jgi:hypothetical protein